MLSRKHLRIAAVVLGLSLVAAACGDDDDDAGGTDTTAGGGERTQLALAWVGPLTGDYANLGIFSRDGAKVAIEQFNETNEDYEIELKEFDTQGDPAQAPTQLDRYINDESVVGVIGPTFSGETNAVLPTLQEEGLVMVSPSATNVDLPSAVPADGVFHRILPDDNAQSEGLVKYMSSVLEVDTVGIVHDNSDYGKGLAVDQLAPKLTDAGIEVVATEAIDPESQDFSSAVNAMDQAAPDVVFFGGYYEAAGRLKKQLSDAEVDAQYVSADGSLDVGFVEAAAGTADGALLSCPCYFASTAAPGEIGEFAAQYEERIGNAPGTYSTEGFDATNILLRGIVAGNTDRASLLEYVEGLRDVPEAISKEVVFTEEGNIESQGIFVFKVENGEIVLDTATADIE
ncbi:MAG TPA: branched-chain amino acid ABC transporter substrate-binding protein [Acidimicrobiales bacterium]|nr:branched-chain amino acid ABC transporter substrate-binding protein [Acidimicrobiales bacterium]